MRTEGRRGQARDTVPRACRCGSHGDSAGRENGGSPPADAPAETDAVSHLTRATPGGYRKTGGPAANGDYRRRDTDAHLLSDAARTDVLADLDADPAPGGTGSFAERDGLAAASRNAHIAAAPPGHADADSRAALSPPVAVAAVAPAPPSTPAPGPSAPLSSAPSLPGEWDFRADAGKAIIAGTLKFRSTTAGLAGVYVGLHGNATELSNLHAAGAGVSFDLVTPTAVWHLDGTVSGNSIDGTFQTAERSIRWTATRRTVIPTATPTRH
ncbi:MAG TPA: hypothetical protein VJ776_02805 [Thermoanaerobaculia bacterium]|nr:hypothetical protein [Thermoanaerobaculia bacterium]